MTSNSADVAIVGAGPAGAWAAHELARRGARVTIFDGSHPREKPCGGGVSARAFELVAHSVGPLPATSIRSARFIDSRSRTQATVSLDGCALTVASRAAFDDALLGAAMRAGARHCRARVLDVEAIASGVKIRTRIAEHRADFVIGADGATSLVRRRLAAPFHRDQLSIATGFFVHGITSDEIVIELVGEPPGYIWSFPRPDHLAVGICAQADAGYSADALRARAAMWIHDMGIGRRVRLQAYSWPIPSLSARDFSKLALAGSRWCLIGDAAGLVDPITREGIHLAIASGAWAADAILSGDLPGRYAQAVQREAVPELGRAARFKAGFFRPRFATLLLDALQHSDRVRAVMGELVAGHQSYRTLKWRLMKTFELRLAWRALSVRSSRRGL